MEKVATKEILLFEIDDIKLEVPVSPEQDTVWLNRSQMAELFGRDIKTIGKHIGNALREELDSSTVAKYATVQTEGGRQVTRDIEYYNLDMIISVGYRVKSKRGTAFRKWANSVLKQYIIQGYAINQNRMMQLGEVIRILKRTENSLDAKQVLSVIERYNLALELLRFLYKGIIIKHNKTEPTYTKTSLFLCEKRRFFMARTEKGGKVF